MDDAERLAYLGMMLEAAKSPMETLLLLYLDYAQRRPGGGAVSRRQIEMELGISGRTFRRHMLPLYERRHVVIHKRKDAWGHPLPDVAELAIPSRKGEE